MNSESKSIIDWIINKFINVVNIQPMKDKIDKFITYEYQVGMDRAEVQFDMNFTPNEGDVKVLNNYVYDNMKQHTDAIGEELRQELSRGLMNGENIPELKKRVQTVFKDKKYSDRLKTVLRTEKMRANNYGALAGAQQTGLELRKYLSVVMDDRTSAICKVENRKFGSKGQAIPVDNEFVVKVDNKTYKAQAPPFHPNCRSVIRFIRQSQFERIEEKHRYIKRWGTAGNYRYLYPEDLRKRKVEALESPATDKKSPSDFKDAIIEEAKKQNFDLQKHIALSGSARSSDIINVLDSSGMSKTERWEMGGPALYSAFKADILDAAAKLKTSWSLDTPTEELGFEVTR